MDSILTKDEDITADHIKQMQYLEAVIKETLRLYPPAGGFERKVNEDTKVGDYTIPKGTCVQVFVYGLHMDSNVFPDPFEFRPERFLKDSQESRRNAFSFLPFSAGARNCIGQRFAMNEMKVVLAKVLLNFRIKSLEKRSDVKTINALICKPENGIKVEISPKSVE